MKSYKNTKALTSPNLDLESIRAKIRHGFFTRSGGVSKGIYEGLNCGPGSSDEPSCVAENRHLVAEHISNRRDTPLLTSYQVHGSDVIEVDGNWGEARPKVDAMVSKTPGVILGILTADCVPVLFADPEAGVIGAAHAGWKGAAAGIIEATVSAMTKLGASRGNIHVAIGPCISQQSYEVDASFKQTFTDLDTSNHSYFISGADKDHFMFDLEAYAEDCVKACRVASIECAKTDTYPESNNLFSYRRATHNNEGDYGRQISTIMLQL